MNENAIQFTDAAAKAATVLAVKAGSAEGRSSGSLFFELLSSALAGSLTLQVNQDAPAPQMTERAPETFRSGDEGGSAAGRFEVAPERRGQSGEREIERDDDFSAREKQTVQPVKDSARPEQTSRAESAEKPESGREAPAGESAAKPEARDDQPKEAVKQVAPQSTGKPAAEAAKVAIKVQAESAPPESKPSADSGQPLMRQVRPAATAEVAKPTEPQQQQQAAQNAAATGLARQAQEAPRPANVVDITQLLNRAAARTAQEAVQPSADSQGARNGGEPAADQTATAAAMQEIMNAGAEAQAQTGKAAFAAALQSQASAPAPAQPAGQQASPATQAVAPAVGNTAARTAEAPARPAEAEAARQPLPAERVINQVIRAARISINQGRDEIKLLLKPDSLGWLKVKISVEGQSVTARITVENEGVRELLEGNVRQLQQALNGQNLKVGQIVIELSGDAERQARESAGDGAKGKPPKIASIAGGEGQAEQPAPAPMEEVLYRSTQVDLRV